MHTLVIGGTGYLGSAITRALATAGHRVTVVTRNGQADGYDARRVDLTRPDTLSGLITDHVDAVIHAATPGGDWGTEEAAVRVLLAQRPATFVYTSGVWVLGPTDDADESTPAAPIPLVAGRPAVERTVLDAEGVRGVVVRPGIVHGSGAGIPALLVGWAQQDGQGRYVGDPGTRWPAVHVDDLADLYVQALTAPAGSVLHGVAEDGVPVTDIATAADRAAGGSGTAAGWLLEAAAGELGAGFAQALGTSQRVRATAARALGWRPTRPGIVTDLAEGSYRR